MGVGLYNSSPTARAVWDPADEHSLAVHRFSIIERMPALHRPLHSTILISIPITLRILHPWLLVSTSYCRRRRRNDN
jgi:hypothetical protein